MYERFTDRARKVMQLANQEAQRFNHESIDVGHIIVGLAKEGSGVASNVLKNLDVNLQKIRDHIEQTMPSIPSDGTVIMGRLPLTDAVKAIVAGACEEARGLSNTYVGTEHILLGVLRQQEELPLRFGVTAQQVREEIVRLLGGGKTDEPTPSKTDRRELAMGIEVMKSPEFLAFCKRFGINMDLPTSDLTIQLDMRLPMKVTQTYWGSRSNGGDE